MFSSIVLAVAAGVMANAIYDLLKHWHRKRRIGKANRTGAKQGGGE